MFCLKTKVPVINEIELEFMTNTISDLYIEIESILQSIVFKTNLLNTNENSNLSASHSSNTDQNITSSQIRLPVLQL